MTDNVKVRDHCHFTGKFRGIAHRKCNLEFQVTRMTPVFFHNLKYDTRMFIREIVKSYHEIEFDMKCIAKNTEKFISFTKSLVVDEVIENGKSKQW